MTGLGNPVPGRIYGHREKWPGPPSFRVTAPFGALDADHPTPHQGIDFGNGQAGAPVLAVAAGVITEAFLDGRTGAVIIRQTVSGNPRMLVGYAHLQRLEVGKGQQVARGQQIGHVGMTGANASHLHWGVRISGTEVDGWPLLEQNQTMPKIDLISLPDGPHTCLIAAGSTVEGWTDTKKIKSQTWTSASSFPADVKVKITQDVAPKGTFWHCTAGYYAGLYVPLTQVTDGGPATPDQAAAYNQGRSDVIAAAEGVPPK